ncbi:hypothetical protein GCM10010095_84890 [Streptomyces anthocyanicus]|nr:hypothetical protein GCM10010095_84890 [Streptomyces anthocyanicus]
MTDLNTLLTALYVKIDDEIEGTRWLGRPPPAYAQRLRNRLPRSGPGPARLPLRGPLVALRAQALVRDAPLPAPACGLQQASAFGSELGVELLRSSFKPEKQRYGESMLKKCRQLIKSVNDTLKGQLDLEQHGGRTFEGVAIRVAQRGLAMAAGIWHNNQTGERVARSLIAFDH